MRRQVEHAHALEQLHAGLLRATRAACTTAGVIGSSREPHADRVLDRVGHRGRDRDDPGLAEALGAERPLGVARLDQAHDDLRHVVGLEHRVVHERRGQHLPLLDHQPLAERVAEPHVDAAVDLALGGQRVERAGRRRGRRRSAAPRTTPVAVSTSSTRRLGREAVGGRHVAAQVLVEHGRSADRRTPRPPASAPARAGGRRAPRGRTGCAAAARRSTKMQPSAAARAARPAPPSSAAAMARSCARSFSAARRAALPAMNVVRLAWAPTSHGFTAVSELTTSTRSSGTPSVSATIMASTVSEPCPISRGAGDRARPGRSRRA